LQLFAIVENAINHYVVAVKNIECCRTQFLGTKYDYRILHSQCQIRCKGKKNRANLLMRKGFCQALAAKRLPLSFHFIIVLPQGDVPGKQFFQKGLVCPAHQQQVYHEGQHNNPVATQCAQVRHAVSQQRAYHEHIS
jgi:hypothetical protein